MAEARDKWTSLPEFPIPAEYANAGDYLRALAQNKIDEMVKFGWGGVACHAQRLKEELDVLCLGYPENILIVNDYVQAARAAGHRVDARTGSACASEVLYALGVTFRSPMSEGLRFEEFVNPIFAKDWVPSIGIRTSEEGKAFILNYLIGKYGKDHAARVGCDERSVVMSGKKIPNMIPVDVDESGIPVTNCKMEDILKANLCIYTIDATPVHPIERECLRETNGQLVYREQLADILQLMSGQTYAWASWAQRCLSTKQTGKCEKLKEEFIRAALANCDFRIGRWTDETLAITYIEKRWAAWYMYGNRLLSFTHIVSGDHNTRTVTHRDAIGEVNFQDIENALHKGERVVVLMRHAERPPLEKNDPTFGENLGITTKGQLDAKVFGFALHEYSTGLGKHCVSSSKTRRCWDTAREISNALAGELPSGCVALPDILGDKSPYFGLVSERMALADEGNYIASLNQYFKDGHQRGFQNLADATDKLEDFMWNDWAHINLPLHVMVTHDINVGCFLAGRKVVTEFDEFSWPHYLDAAVGFLDRCGRARYGYMRYKPNTYTFDC